MANRLSTVSSLVSTLSAGLSRSRFDRHEFIVDTVGDILALHICAAPPKGYGDRADYLKLADILEGSGLPRYARAVACLSDAAHGRGVHASMLKGRSVRDWETAREQGLFVSGALFADCTPKVRTPEQIKKAQDAAAKRKADAAPVAAVFTAQAVTGAIGAGQFKPEEVQAIATACRAMLETLDVAKRAAIAESLKV